MTINLDYINNFSNKVERSSLNGLQQVLRDGRELRLGSGKKVHFWNFEQKKVHQAFDQVYARGIERLATASPSKISTFTSKIICKSPFSDATRKAALAAKIGLSGFAGWLVGKVYTQSMSNLILHEYGHAWAMNQTYDDANPHVSANAKYWLEQGDWSKWFWGVRTGAPGNWTSSAGGPLTALGNWLTPTDRDLFISFAGVGAELVVNSLIAGLGLIALKKKHKALGASLLGFALISHSAGHSYLRRCTELLKEWDPKAGGDPPRIALDLSSILGCSPVEAFRFLYYGYLFAPLALLAALVFLFIKPTQEIPDECVLMRLLTENNSLELKKVLAQVEVEMGVECGKMESLEEKEKEQLMIRLSDRLIEKIKENRETCLLFKNTRRQISQELKGKVNPYVNFAFRLRGIAMIVAFLAYQVRLISQELAPKLLQLFNFLAGLFIIAQSISFILDCVQTVSDVFNERITQLTKVISVARTSLSLATLVIISTSLFVPGLNAITLPFLIISSVVRLVFFAIHIREMRKMAVSQKNDTATPSLEKQSA